MSKHVKISVERAKASSDLGLAAKDILEGGFEDANLRRLKSCVERFEACKPAEEDRENRFFKVHLFFVDGRDKIICMRGNESVPESLIISFVDPTPVWCLRTVHCPAPLILVKEKIVGWSANECATADN